MSTLPVLISGSGLCGLLIGRALATHKIPFIIYERDKSFFQRAQGYRLRMSVEGLAAIERILTPEAWKEFRAGVATTRGSGLQTLDALTGEPKKGNGPPGKSEESKDDKPSQGENPASAPGSGPQKNAQVSEGGTVISGLGPSGEVYGVSRGYLRESLMKSIADKVQYGKHTTSYTVTDSGVVAHFADGTDSPEGCMLIGADGVNSSITKQLTDHKLKIYDTGARMIHGQTTTTAFKGLGEGVWSIRESKPQGGSVGMITNVRPGDMDDPKITFGWTMVGSPGIIEAPGGKYQVVGKVAADLSRDLTTEWFEKVKPIFKEQVEEEAGFWKVTTSSPDGVPDWPNDPRVTIVGDAAHAMTPAGGNGANTALVTASILGTVMRENEGWKKNVTGDYEGEMRKVASANVKRSFETAKGMMGIKELTETDTGVQLHL